MSVHVSLAGEAAITASGWHSTCELRDILPGTGVAALVEDQQIAIFRLADDSVYALGNVDPFSNAAVLARGLLGDVNGVLVVASPIYKQRFRLHDGVCQDDESVKIASYPVALVDGVILVKVVET